MAVQILAGIRKGAETDEIPQEIDGVAITETMDGGSRRISYACPLNDMQAISVELEQKGTECTVISWKLVPDGTMGSGRFFFRLGWRVKEIMQNAGNCTIFKGCRRPGSLRYFCDLRSGGVAEERRHDLPGGGHES